MTRFTGRTKIQTGRISSIMLLRSSPNWVSLPLLLSPNRSLKRRKTRQKSKKLRSLSLLLALNLLDPGEETPTVDLVLKVEEVATLVEEPLPLGSTEGVTPLPLPLPSIPVGGRLGHFAQNWANITDDNWVLSMVRKGYVIPFRERPVLCQDPLFFQQHVSQQLEKLVTNLLLKGAVEKIQRECPGFYAQIFLVPKKNGKLQLI